MFCHECGKPLTSVTQTEPAEAAARISNPVAAANAEPVADQERQILPASTVAAAPATAANKTGKPAESGPRHGARERTRERLQRASSVARGAIEDNVKRVEKLHHVSTAMIEEAHTDSSLRFVLVALGLFIVFIILLVLSKVMG